MASEKVSIKALTSAYAEVLHGESEIAKYDSNLDFDPSYEWDQLCRKNENLLYDNKFSDYNQKSFKTLINSIEANGIDSFNMTTFISNITKYLKNSLNSSLIHEMDFSGMTQTSKDVFSKSTQAFNCNSIGCIAGFATAHALKWKQPQWLTDDSRNHVDFFEHIACNWLNIPLSTGKSMFYGDNDSVWTFVRFFESKNYQQIEWVEEMSSVDCESPYYKKNAKGNQWVRNSLKVELNSINHKYAVDVLQRIMNGEIIIDSENDFIPKYSTKQKVRK
jgi:hypothetical protein